MPPSIIITLSGLMGACGVALAAAAAHAAPGAGLESAAQMLLFHAVAALAILALLDQGRLWRPAAMLAVVGWIVGSALFSGDIALRAFIGSRLFPMAAPTGGVCLIVSWLSVVASAIVRRH